MKFSSVARFLLCHSLDGPLATDAVRKEVEKEVEEQKKVRIEDDQKNGWWKKKNIGEKGLELNDIQKAEVKRKWCGLERSMEGNEQSGWEAEA